MISKNIIKYIHSLEYKKNRIKEGLFVAEGPKVVGDIMESSEPELLIATEEWFDESGFKARKQDITVSKEDLRKVSFLQHPQQVAGLFKIPDSRLDAEACCGDLCLALDKIQDPGNLGTIIRIADWFGIKNIICNEGTVDAYSPKVVQATMGSLAHVNIAYTCLEDFLDRIPDDVPVYGTSLDGTDIYEQPISPSGIIVMGNEGNGISASVMERVTRSLFIPCYQENRKTDSLNVAIATAITCSEFRRRLNH